MKSPLSGRQSFRHGAAQLASDADDDSRAADQADQFGRHRAHRTTRAPPPFMSFSTSLRVAIEVSPGVVEAKAPWAAP